MSYEEDRREQVLIKYCSEALGDGFNIILSNDECVIYETKETVVRNSVEGKIIVPISDIGSVMKPEYSAEIVFTPKPETLTEEQVNSIKWQFGFGPNDNFEVNQLGVYEYGLLNTILSRIIVHRKKDLSVIPSVINKLKGE